MLVFIYHFCVLSHIQTDQELEEIKSRGTTLLYNDCQVSQWLKWRVERGFPELKEHHTYVEVTVEEMDDFYSFKAANCTPGRVELPYKELLQYYSITKKKHFPICHRYGDKFISMSINEVNLFCEWISCSRETLPSFD